MKKLKMIFLVIISSLFLTSCGLKTNILDNATIYTTIYPVEYITKYLYGTNSKIESIYPVGVDINNYELTDKQIEKFANANLFVYVGLGKETKIAKSFINKNRNLLIIDATYGLTSNNLEELWLAPNNFLMLAKNIKTSLNEYLDNSLKEEEVNKKYDELYKNISWIDAELRNIAKEAKDNGNNTLVVSNNKFDYLKGYGFNIISLQSIEASGSENAIKDIKNKFKTSTYNTIIKLSGEEETEFIKELNNTYKAKIVNINDLITNSDTASDYITIQNENLSIIRDILLK